MVPIYRPLQGVVQVAEQVPAVGDLNGLGGAGGRAADVIVGPVAADDLDFGMVLQPITQRLRRPLGQQIHWAAALQVAEDRAVVVALAEGPVIDAQDADARMLAPWRLANAAEQRIRARRHGQPRRQPRARLAAQGQADLGVGLMEPGSGPGPYSDEVGPALGEDAARAVGGGAEEAAGAQLEMDRSALPGEVLESAAVTAVDPLGGLPATRAVG